MRESVYMVLQVVLEEFNLLRENKKKKITYALTNNFAFGGINTVLVIKNERI